MTEPTIILASSCLLSKWGFGDGDTPNEWGDYLEAQGYTWDAFEYPLVELVRKYLLPEVCKHHTIDVVEIDTSHNPIRAERVDGIEIDWYGDEQVTLTPEWVDVPLADALNIAVSQA